MRRARERRSIGLATLPPARAAAAPAARARAAAVAAARARAAAVPAARAAAVGAALALALAVAAVTPVGSASARLAAPRRAPVPGQLITVVAASHLTTYATLRAYSVVGRRRILVFGPWMARVGYNGVAPRGQKREGDGRTPSGTFGLTFFFGVDRWLAFSFPFRHAFRYDYWDDDPASPRYNEWVDARRNSPGAHPEPMHQVPAYDYAAVIGYNVPRVPGLGSAIFLHVGTGTATAGCVSLPRPQLIKILLWLDPKAAPHIAISG